MNKPELLIPAGNLDKLKIACLYGADAVFLGGYEYGLRSNSDNFSLDDIKEGCEFAREYNVDVYVTTNIYAHQENLVGFEDFVKHLSKCGVKGIIVSDPAYIKMCKEVAPEIEIHISTQHSITNYEAVNFYKRLGASRVVLARELSMEEIKEIVDNTDLEIEIFIHGAVCSSYSGRCTLSNHMTSRDSNRGGCCQSCRWDYELYEVNSDDSLVKVNISENDPDFNMSAKDMNVIKHLDKILELGVDSLKVEGRMKTYHYVASVTKVYRQAIDEYFKDPKNFSIKKEWIDELSKTESRLSYIGALAGDLSKKGQIYKEQYQKTTGYDFVGMVIDNEDDLVVVEQRNLFEVGDEIEVLSPYEENFSITIDTILDQDNNEIKRANHPLMITKLNLGKNLPKYSILRKVVK